jgi:hypothetical protein
MVRTAVLLCGSLFAFAVVAGEESPPQDIRIAGPEQLAAHWTPAGSPTGVPYPVELASRGVTGCLTLAYIIEPDGSTSSFRTLDAAASNRSPLAKRQAIEAFAKAAAAAVATWRFTPVDEPRRTLTATTVEFDGKDSAAAQQCEAGDVARALAKGRAWDGILQDLFQSRWRFNTGELSRSTR